MNSSVKHPELAWRRHALMLLNEKNFRGYHAEKKEYYVVHIYKHHK
jgi:hypothetical protein